MSLDTMATDRPIPTVQASPGLLHEGDMVYPDIQDAGNPFRVVDQPRLLPAHGTAGPYWRIPLEHDDILCVPVDGKVRTQRRPNPGPPTPPEMWDAAMASYQEPRYG
jgi:hypothetical protein